MPSFIHAADLHLDSPLRGLSRYEGAPVEALRGATRRALSNLVDQAIRRRVDLLVIAGDIYDGDWKDYNTGLFFSNQMARLQLADIPVVMISGNHDAASVISRELSLPENVTRLSSKEPESVDFPELEFTVHGQSFANPVVTEDLSLNYPAPKPNRFNIGLLHTSADGRPNHDPYAPCSVERLKLLGYDYWALGHIHQRETLSRSPWIVFSGNLQGRHARELGPKGATLVTVEQQKVVDVKALVTDAVRWAKIEFCCDDFEDEQEILRGLRDRFAIEIDKAEERLVAVRLELSGASELFEQVFSAAERWKHQIYASSAELRSPGVWIEKVKFRPLVTEKSTQSWEDFADFLPGIQTFGQQADELELVAKELFGELESKLPLAWREGEDGLRPTDPERVKASLLEAKQHLLSLLSQGTETDT